MAVAMHRRDVLKISATVAAVPALAQTAKKTETASSAGFRAEVFSVPQMKTVAALVDVIIPTTDTPGAAQAKVHEYMDKILAAGPQAERDRFLQGLDWLEQYSSRQFGGPFTSLKPADQVKLLETLQAGPEEGDLGEGHKFFRMAKQMTSRIYYQTAIGFRELNKGGRVPAKYGCTHPDHHA